MDDMQSLASSLKKLEAMTGGKKNKQKRPSKKKILAILASEYGYEAYKDAKNNVMTAKEMVSLLEQIDKKRYSDRIEMAIAFRVAQSNSQSDFDKYIKQWSKEAE